MAGASCGRECSLERTSIPAPLNVAIEKKRQLPSISLTQPGSWPPVLKLVVLASSREPSLLRTLTISAIAVRISGISSARIAYDTGSHNLFGKSGHPRG